MRFETITDLNKLDCVFSRFARYGSVELYNKLEPKIMQENHRISTFGSGLSGSESSTVLKRRSYTKKGIDFKYNTTTNVLSFSVRYEVVNVQNDSILQSFLAAQTCTAGTTRPSVHQVTEDVPTSYNSTIKEGNEFHVGDVAYIITEDYSEDMNTTGVTCEVVEIEDINIVIGSRTIFSASDVHKFIIDYLSNSTPNE